MRYSCSVSKASGAAAGWVTQFRTPSNRDARIWEIHAFAETAVAGTLALVRSLTVGSGFTSTTPQTEDGNNVTAAGALCLVDTAATVAPTEAAAPVNMRRIALPATIGSGIIWQFPDGLVIPVSSGLLVWQLSAAAVTYGLTFVHEE
jgi:hypothetical protein